MWLCPALLCSLLGLLGLLAQAWATEAKDGHIYQVAFHGRDNEAIEYTYTPTDPKAILTVMLYSTIDANEDVVTYIKATGAQCPNFSHEYQGYFTESYKVYSSISNGDNNDYDITNCEISVKMVSSSAITMNLSIVSSIILINNKEFTITDTDSEDTYDYEAHNYIRYFRAFVCERLSGRGLSPTVNILDESRKSKVYVYGWNVSNIQEPGRPNSTNGSSCSSDSNCNIGKLGDSEVPGWVFIGVDVKDLFTYTPTSEDDPTYDHNVTITVQLEVPSGLSSTSYLDLDLGVYEGCSRLVRFNPSDWGTVNEDGELEDYSLSFGVMTKEQYNHENIGLFQLFAGPTYPLTQENRRLSVPDNVAVFSTSEVKYYNAVGEGYVSVSMVNGVPFPQPSVIGSVINFYATMLKIDEVIGVGKKATSLTLKRSTTDETGCDFTVDYTRVFLTSVGLNRPEYAVESEGSSVVMADYVVLATTVSSGFTPELSMGAYIGAGSAYVPYRTQSTTECKTIDDIQTEYMFKSRTFKGSEDLEIKKDVTYLVIPYTSSQYYQDGAYIVDIYNSKINTSVNAEDIAISVESHPRWRIRPGVQYNMYLNGQSRFDFFLLDLNDLNRGVSFSVEPTVSATSDVTFNIYASFLHETPGEYSRFSTSGKGRADLFIDPDDLKELEGSDDYYVYVAIDTQYKGEVLIYYTEGNTIQYHLNDSDNVKVVMTKDVPWAGIEVHSTKIIQANDMIIYFEANRDDFADGSYIDVCIADGQIDDISQCPLKRGIYINRETSQYVFTLTLSGSAELHPDYFIYMVTTFKTSTKESIPIRIYAAKRKTLSVSDSTILEGPAYPTPLVSYLNTKSGKDYTMHVDLETTSAINARYSVRVCASYPSFTMFDPPDVDDENVRHCLTQSVVTGASTTFDIIGDSLSNDSTLVNDSVFIGSAYKYVTFYPEIGIPFINIKTYVYEDEHINTDEDSKSIVIKKGQITYFRLHILSIHSLSSKDLLSFKFEGDYPIDYCLSSTPHTDITSDEKICKKSHITTDESELEANHDGILPMYEIDELYSANHDAYVYFSVVVPDEYETDLTSMKTSFSNVIVHYLEQIKSKSDSLETKMYEFQLYSDRLVAFYTTGITLDTPFRFFLVPNVVKNEHNYVSLSYANSVVGLKGTTTTKSALPVPEIDDSDKYGAGILMWDKKITEDDLIDDVNQVIVVARFVSTNPVPGRYKAGFLSSSSETNHILADMTIVEDYTQYHISNNNMSGNTPSNRLLSDLFYYPHALTDKVISVLPCAGAPAIYQSYINPLPVMNGEFVESYPDPITYNLGDRFTNHFMAFDGTSYSNITTGTGFIFNATAFAPSYYDSSFSWDKLRWEADFAILPESESMTGGPKVPNGNYTFAPPRGAELEITFSPAITTRRNTHLEYAIYTIPAATGTHAQPSFDASPATTCGLFSFGFPLTVDTEKEGKPTRWYRADNNDPNSQDTLSGSITLTTNYDPASYEYPSDVKPNYYDPKKDDSLSASEKDDLKSLFNVNVVVREVIDNDDGSVAVVGYSSYQHQTISITGSLPISEGGLFGWEIAIIVIVVIIVVGGIIAIVVYGLIKKKKSMGYDNVDGQGAPKNIDIDIGGADGVDLR